MKYTRELLQEKTGFKIDQPSSEGGKTPQPLKVFYHVEWPFYVSLIQVNKLILLN